MHPGKKERNITSMATALNSSKPTYVLIMEDNVHHAELLTEILDRHFAPVIIHTVDTFEDGLEFLEQSTYDVILSAGYIADESIIDIVRDIVGLAKGTPVIVVTGRGNERFAAKLTRRGIAEYVVKSRDTLELLPNIIKKHIKRSKRVKSDKFLPTHKAKTYSPSSKELVREIERIRDELIAVAAAAKAKHKAKSLPTADQLTKLQRKIEIIKKQILHMKND